MLFDEVLWRAIAPPKWFITVNAKIVHCPGFTAIGIVKVFWHWRVGRPYIQNPFSILPLM